MTVDPIPGIAGSVVESAPSGPGFVAALAEGLGEVDNAQHRVDDLAAEMAAGGDVEPHELTIAASQAQLSVDIATTMRDRALDAYQEIMRLQV